VASSLRVAIIGGGIGGLAAALALARRGLAVEVYEKSPQLSEIGAGLNLSPNGLKALRHLGVERDAVAWGCESEFQDIRNWRSGRIITRHRRSGIETRFGANFLTIHRADLQSILANRLPPGTVRLGYNCVAVEPGPNGALARFEDGRTVEADVIVGADGIRSAVRASLFGPDAPHFTGCVCWRGLVPAAALSNPISLAMTAWWGPHGHVVHYPVRRGELINWVAHYDSDAWLEESWTRECDRAEIATTYARWHASLQDLFRLSERHYKWALFDRDPLPQWGRERVTLLGDACHPMLPYLGQGATMAVEDGCVLADCLASIADPGEALRTYERLRMPRTRRAQLGSRQRAKENHLPSAWARFKRDVRLKLRSRFGADNTPHQAAWIYGYDVAQALTEPSRGRAEPSIEAAAAPR
jgi:salicylate hydroxylase